MKSKMYLILCLALLLFSLSVPLPAADTDIELHRECKECGMDRKAYGYSRMLFEYKGGRSIGTCSLHCLVMELDGSGAAEVAAIKVADRDSRQLIDAEKAFWVIGGQKRGVMTPVGKWAFATEGAAREFIAANGGKQASWSDVLATTREELKQRRR
ncbi:MAG: nitrous oxide reductase accessory protein NosL [Desulfuromonadaceae bacterium]|nr:nitrous oxide reductase accessory protein NosL [Desulfuromonadaceae bacterium]MDD2856321.1 nitrous oxide reductase accessory protein NosL [Desulfuromonadaceae bacterium]